MANYDTKNMRLVHEFEHRGIHVYVYKTVRGARHCSIDHEPHEKECTACHRPIAPLTVFVAIIAGKILFDSLSANDLVEQTKLYLDENDPSAPSEPSSDDGPEEPPDEPKIDLPPPSGQPKGKSGVAPIEERMERLGWPAWIRDLANHVEKEERKKRPPTRK